MTSDGENNGYLKFKAEYQWQIGNQAPSALGEQIGSLVKTTKGFGEKSPSFAQLYWEQHISKNVFILDLGKLDATNYYSDNVAAGDREYFMNAAFSAIPAIATPGNGLGVNAKFTPIPWFYLTAGFQQQQGTDSIHQVENFSSDFDIFSSAEVGFRPVISGLGQGNYRFTFWHADDIPDKSLESDHGFAGSFDQVLSPRWVTFSRYEYDNGELTGIRQLVTGGIGCRPELISSQDIFGVALAWGQPAQESDREQYEAEVFYRLQISLTEQLSIGYQVIADPTFAPHDDVVGVFWTRFRILF